MLSHENKEAYYEYDQRANGKIENFTDKDGKEVQVDNDVVWADEKKPIKDVLDVDAPQDLTLDIDATDQSEDVVAKDC